MPEPTGFMMAHALLMQARALVMRAKELDLLTGASVDTCFAMGEVLGTIDKAKALLGRDVDMARELPLATWGSFPPPAT